MRKCTCTPYIFCIFYYPSVNDDGLDRENIRETGREGERRREGVGRDVKEKTSKRRELERDQRNERERW